MIEFQLSEEQVRQLLILLDRVTLQGNEALAFLQIREVFVASLTSHEVVEDETIPMNRKQRRAKKN